VRARPNDGEADDDHDRDQLLADPAGLEFGAGLVSAMRGSRGKARATEYRDCLETGPANPRAVAQLRGSASIASPRRIGSDLLEFAIGSSTEQKISLAADGCEMEKGDNMKSRSLLITVAFLALTTLVLAVWLTPRAASANAGPPAYVVSAGLTGNGIFGTVDLTTGVFRPRGPGEPDGYFGLAPGPNGTLMSLTYAGNLVSINPGTGVPTQIGPTGLAACVDPTSPSCGPTSAFAIGGFDGKIYATDFANSIYAVNPHTGAATLLAEFSGIPPSPFVLGSQNNDTDGTLNFADEAIWQSGGKLYATYDAWIFDPVSFSVSSIVIQPALYQIDPTTGLATEIGPTALGIGGVVDLNGTDYAFDDLTGQILKLDLTSGNVTPVGNFAAAAGVIQGAAPPSSPSFERPSGWVHWRWGGPRRP
jgi:hypothetical protein